MNGARGRMTFRTTVQRLTPGLTNPDGHPVFNGWSDLDDDVPCYVWDTEHIEHISVNTTAVVTTVRAMVPYDTDIHEGDRLYQVRTLDQSVFRDEIFRVNGVSVRQFSHKELQLERVH